VGQRRISREGGGEPGSRKLRGWEEQGERGWTEHGGGGEAGCTEETTTDAVTG
jgi:hypothetical protein